MIFVSYAWTNEKHKHKVLAFVNFLRERGYNAECDINAKERETAISFPEMMAKSLPKAEKVIVILNKQYKIKADNFLDGVGVEYRYILNDIEANKNKYVLVSFESLNKKVLDETVPYSLQGREVVDLTKDEEDDYLELFSKLENASTYEFKDVNPMKKPLEKKQLGAFNAADKIYLLSFENKEYDEIPSEERLSLSRYFDNGRFLKDGSWDTIKQEINHFVTSRLFRFIDFKCNYSITFLAGYQLNIKKSTKKVYACQVAENWSYERSKSQYGQLVPKLKQVSELDTVVILGLIHANYDEVKKYAEDNGIWSG